MTLRRIWSTAVPDGRGWLVASPDRVILGKGRTDMTDLTGMLVILDAHTGRILQQTVDIWRVEAMAVSGDGRSLALSETSSGLGGPSDVDRIRILDLETGRERSRFAGDPPLGVQGLAFSADDLSIAAIGNETTLVFDAVTGRERWRRQLDGSFVTAWNPVPDSIAVGSQRGVAILDARSGTQRLLLPTPTLALTLAYSPDGSRLVVGCVDGTMRVFLADTGVQSWSRDLGESGVAVGVSADARWVAGFSDRILAVLDLETSTPRYPPVVCDVLGNVQFSPTLRHLFVGGRSTTVIDARTGRLLQTSPGISCLIPADGSAIAALDKKPVTLEPIVERRDLQVAVSAIDIGTSPTAIDISPNDMPLVAVAGTNQHVIIIVTKNGTSLADKAIGSSIASVAFVEGGQKFAVGGSGGVSLFTNVGDPVWTGADIGSVNAVVAAGTAGEWVALAAGKTVRLLSTDRDRHARWASPAMHPQTVTRLAASADGKWIATGCADRKTRVLDAVTGGELFRVDGGARVEALTFTRDSARLASANEDGTLVLIALATLSEQGRVTNGFACTHIAFSADGRLISAAYANRTVSIFEVSGAGAPEQVQRLTMTAPVSGLSFNAIDRSLAIAIDGGTVVVYDAHDAIELVRIVQPRPVGPFGYSANGKLIVTTGDDGFVRAWTSGV